jgi:hypothetical protein
MLHIAVITTSGALTESRLISGHKFIIVKRWSLPWLIDIYQPDPIFQHHRIHDRIQSYTPHLLRVPMN